MDLCVPDQKNPLRITFDSMQVRKLVNKGVSLNVCSSDVLPSCCWALPVWLLSAVTGIRDAEAFCRDFTYPVPHECCAS